jgi:hypothetical protein
MWKDPLVEEIRKLRDQYASQHNHDIDAIFEDIQQRQAQSDKKMVSFPPRKPHTASNVA